MTILMMQSQIIQNLTLILVIKKLKRENTVIKGLCFSFELMK
jgi:hypothetical protein